MKTGFQAEIAKRSAWKKLAFVSGVDWVSKATHLFAWAMPGEALVVYEIDQARPGEILGRPVLKNRRGSNPCPPPHEAAGKGPPIYCPADRESRLLAVPAGASAGTGAIPFPAELARWHTHALPRFSPRRCPAGGSWSAVATTGVLQREEHGDLDNPVTGTFSPGPDMGVARYAAAAAPLPDGRVLVAGGREPSQRGGLQPDDQRLHRGGGP